VFNFGHRVYGIDTTKLPLAVGMKQAQENLTT
jgi:hypothetical protein